MGNPIYHTGIVKAVTPDSVTVLVDPAEAECKGCAIAALCTKGETLTFACPGVSPALIGKKVTITVPGASRRRASWLFLIIPLVLLLGVSAAGLLLRFSDLVAVCSSLGVISLWYLALYLLRDKINNSHITIVPV